MRGRKRGLVRVPPTPLTNTIMTHCLITCVTKSNIKTYRETHHLRTGKRYKQYEGVHAEERIHSFALSQPESVKDNSL